MKEHPCVDCVACTLSACLDCPHNSLREEWEMKQTMARDLQELDLERAKKCLGCAVSWGQCDPEKCYG